MADCDYVLHVASPFPSHTPKDDDEIIRPARDGVLRAARDAPVKRVVMTSSFDAIGYGHSRTKTTFSEETWTNLEGDDVTAYIRSKALADRAAWEFVEQQGGEIELAVINPVGIFGPVLGADVGSSVQIVARMCPEKCRLLRTSDSALWMSETSPIFTCSPWSTRKPMANASSLWPAKRCRC